MTMEQVLVNALVAGSIYALVAVGYTLVYGTLNFINFAHGEIFMSGAYFFLFFSSILHFPFTLAMLFAVSSSIILGLAIERFAYRPLRWKSRLSILITAIGVSIILQNTVGIIAGFDPTTMNRPFEDGVIQSANARITYYQSVILVTLFIVGIALYFFMRHPIGARMRASGENLGLARDLGINIDRVILLVFALGSGLAAIGGILVGFVQDVSPGMGVLVGLKAFTAAVIGGIGSVPGALWGGLVIGLVENVVVAFLPSGLKEGVVFAVLVLILLFRPRGLLAKADFVEAT